MAPLQRLDLAILALDDPGTDVHLVTVPPPTIRG
jgi:hypothetical protein